MPPKVKVPKFVFARPGVRVPMGFNPSQPFQVGGRRKVGKARQYFLVQNGNGWWDSVKNFASKAWNVVGKPVVKALKDAKVGSQLASKVHPILGSVVSQAGYGQSGRAYPQTVVRRKKVRAVTIPSGTVRLPRGNVAMAY